MKSNALLIGIVTIVIAGGAYWYFFTGTGNQPPLSETGTSTNVAQTQFQALVGELQPISFDSSIFSDARFNALVDLATPVSPESTGRLDPFAAVSNSTVSVASSSSSTIASSSPKTNKTKLK
jgi:hypothetical protein